MKQLLLSLLAAFLFCTQAQSSTAPSVQAPILPESISARDQMAGDSKTETIFLKEKSPQKATEKLNDSNVEYTKRGWTVFTVIPYVEDGDFNGFFVIYQKKLLIE